MSDKAKVLIVDDAQFMRIKIKKCLGSNADIVGEASNGEEALEVFRELLGQGLRPEVVFMDLTMQYKNGIEASRDILKIDPKIKIIIVSAVSDEAQIKQCIKLGISDYIMKPFQDEKLLSAFQDALKK